MKANPTEQEPETFEYGADIRVEDPAEVDFLSTGFSNRVFLSPLAPLWT